MPNTVTYEDDSGTHEFIIKDEPLTVGEYIQIGVYRDQLIEYYGGNPLKSSRETLEVAAQAAKAYIVTLKGLLPEYKGSAPAFLFSQKLLTKPTMELLIKTPPKLISFILKSYDQLAEPPIANNMDDAKKK